MARFNFSPTAIDRLFVVERQMLEDQRGFLSRLFCADELKAAGFDFPIVQINQTLTRKKGAVRGMHFQMPPHAETKLVTCLHGEIFDVAVDLRKNSPTFLHWHGEILSPGNRKALLIPEGFAHGFQALSDDCELIYLHTAAYEPTAERALHACDPMLAVAWPLPITEMSDRDRSHAMLTTDFQGIER